MRTIWLVRHGIAADATRGMRDAERPLTKEGIERMESAARAWRKLGPTPDVIVTSPLLRARQTGKILHDAFDLDDGPLVCDALAAGGGADDLLRFIARDAPEESGVACVGHMPDLPRLLGEITGAGAAFGADFGKGTVAAIEFPGALRVGAGTLRALIPNRVLRAIG